MRIGDKVRFLSQTGGGIVVGFDKKSWAIIKDEDGFEIPMPLKECVVIEENTVGKDAQTMSLQTKNGDELNIALVYTQDNGLFNCILANESNYNLLFTYNLDFKGQRICLFAGEVIPYERKTLFSFDKDALNANPKRIEIKIIPFKRSEAGSIITLNEKLKPIDERKAWYNKNIIEETFVLDPINLLKDSMFKENEYVSARAYVITIAKKDLVLQNDISKVKQELLEKFNSDIKEIKVKETRHQKEKEDVDAIFKINPNGIIEVDLHANELLDTTAGMSNKEILQYQILKFNEIMTTNLKKRGTKIVFIHGKGDGVLRNAIIKELRNKYSKCSYQDASFKEYGFGATMVNINF